MIEEKSYDGGFMSEGLKEVTTDAMEAAKQSLINRFSGAFTAYVVTTWLAINWSDIAILFMSTASVEQRIQAIYGQHGFWLYTLFLPVTIGFSLSIIIPAINAIVVSLTSYFSAKSETSLKRARIKVESELEEQNAKKFAITARLDQLKTDRNYLTSEVEILESKKKALLDSISTSYNDMLTIILRHEKLLKDINPLFKDKPFSYDELKEKLDDLFTMHERHTAELWRQEIRDTWGLEMAQTLLEGRPEKLTADKDLVKELLLASRIEVSKDNSSTTNPPNT